jgi:hypothetical protein
MVVGAGSLGAAEGARSGEARIESIEAEGSSWVIRVVVPAGAVRLVLEGCERGDLKGWMPRAVHRLAAGEQAVEFRVPRSSSMELYRVRVDDAEAEAVPAAFFSGKAEYEPEVASTSSAWMRGDEAVPGVDAGAGDAEAREVVESDIWLLRDDRLYFFNQYRGLQVMDVAEPASPLLLGTFVLPGVGEQMYVLPGGEAVLLAHDPCGSWGVESESAVVVVSTSVMPPVELARVRVRGRVVESRLVGQVLYVATETWQLAEGGNGAWQVGTWITSVNLADPAAPRMGEPLWVPGSGNVVTATDRFLFVATQDYQSGWPGRSDVQVVDIADPGGAIAWVTRIPLAGRVADKFKMNLAGDVLRVVVEALEGNGRSGWVTVLETYRLADPRSAGPMAYWLLDRLELARGERLFATRMDGDRGYLVTYLVVDPLWVVDLSDPEDLRITGELKIPGWSTYMRPMGDRLLTVGIDDVEGWRVAVQLFDVSDPADPRLLSKVPLGENHSWSEANQDEKAFGVFPDAGLLLVPFTTWGEGKSTQAVQLVDMGRDTLRARGQLARDVVPRRAAVHREGVLALSGRELVAADISDRDAPRVTAHLELAYPVDRVLVAGDHLLEWVTSTLRVRSWTGAGGAGEVQLEALPVRGARVVGDRLHLLQGQPAQWVWEPGDAAHPEGTTRIVPGKLKASVWDVSQLPVLQELGSVSIPLDEQGWGDLEALVVEEDLVVWAGGGGGYGYGWRGWEMVDGLMAGDAMVARGDAIWPWGWGGPKQWVSVTLDSEGVPSALRSAPWPGEGEVVGEVSAAGRLLLATRRRMESEVVGTNQVVVNVWESGESEEIPGEDGDARTEGRWVQVTNAYPVVRWWSYYELDGMDFSQAPLDPVVRNPVSVPGELRGVSHGGAMVYVVSRKTDTDGVARATMLEALAYDGVAAHQVATEVLAEEASGQTWATWVEDGQVLVARGGWGEGHVQRLEQWFVTGEGRWESRRVGALSGVPNEMRGYGGTLLVRGGGAMDLFEKGAEGLWEAVSRGSGQLPGCYGGQLNRGARDGSGSVWLPLGDYGSVRVGR